MKKIIPFLLFFVIVFAFFWQFFVKGLLPIPSDDIVGLYHPFRDFYAKDYPNGIPYKNFLITDPVRQQYPWKKLSIAIEKKFKLPLWDPYEMAGKPLLGNFQSGVFYPLNFLFFILPFNLAWSIFIFLQPLLSAIFLYLFLRNLKLDKVSSFFGAFVFAFCGFSIAWLEWGNILHTLIWLPLILLSMDKFTSKKLKNSKAQIIWVIVLILSSTFSFLAGHLQIFFYISIFSLCYLIFRWVEKGRSKKTLVLSLGILLGFIILTSFQSIPTLNFISQSARSIDQSNWQKEGWFIPWQNIIQFIVPDFFGNPATLNYWGVFNYAEFVGYIGIIPLIMSLFALFFRKDKNVFFFGSAFFITLIFAFPTLIAKLPFILNIPFISTAQPTRLISIVDFSLAVLAAFGFSYFKEKSKGMPYILGFIGILFIFLWLSVLGKGQNLLISKQNLILPTIIYAISLGLILLSFIKNKLFFSFIIYLLIALSIFDLFRFGWKFTPFTNKAYLFPQTNLINFLQKQKGEFRIMATDPRILPPNFSTVYKIQSVDGYDPLYLERYGELIAASERKEPNIKPPFGFDRIVTPHNYESNIINLLGVKYVLSLSNLRSVNLKKVFQEGETRVYENSDALPRTFFVENIVYAKSKDEAIKNIFAKDLSKTAVVEDMIPLTFSLGSANIERYSENNIFIKTENQGEGFLLLTDSFYPSWHARIDGQEVKILRSDFNFRGIVVPKGVHNIEFYVTL